MPTATTPFQVYLTVRDGTAAIDFYRRAFGATEDMRQMAEDGKRVMHATLTMLGHHIMLSDEFPEHQSHVVSPHTANGSTVTIHVNLPSRADLDDAMACAAAEGADITMPASEMFWGAYYGRIVDPFGHAWSFAAE